MAGRPPGDPRGPRERPRERPPGGVLDRRVPPPPRALRRRRVPRGLDLRRERLPDGPQPGAVPWDGGGPGRGGEDRDRNLPVLQPVRDRGRTVDVCRVRGAEVLAAAVRDPRRPRARGRAVRERSAGAPHVRRGFGGVPTAQPPRVDRDLRPGEPPRDAREARGRGRGRSPGPRARPPPGGADRGGAAKGARPSRQGARFEPPHARGGAGPRRAHGRGPPLGRVHEPPDPRPARAGRGGAHCPLNFGSRFSIIAWMPSKTSSLRRTWPKARDSASRAPAVDRSAAWFRTAFASRYAIGAHRASLAANSRTPAAN